MNILVSSCLLGNPCRYDGGRKPSLAVIALEKQFRLIPVCPEAAGGLAIPHPPSEQVGGRVISRDGRDVTAAFMLGAKKTLETARRYRCRYAVLKERSPSCGKGSIYDGTFSGRLIPGDGVTAALLMQSGIQVFGESELDSLFAAILRDGQSG